MRTSVMELGRFTGNTAAGDIPGAIPDYPPPRIANATRKRRGVALVPKALPPAKGQQGSKIKIVPVPFPGEASY
jgi:hypothetical protein